ncbi:MAG TPA: exodeoxyribonuclease V subunit beta [Chthoniobacteraceae bacterium]|jgi:exodeoxyribonuclease V beta subunit|nr:exodeoxyribonuclease V subunit beta [Chthoniobacteraceae bacterium]
MKTPPPFQAQDFAHPLLPGATLIEASAGTGKTYTLCAIYLRLVLESALTVQQILVTTFTIAATAELRGRIRGLLRNALDAFTIGATENAFVAAVLAHWEGEGEVMRERLTQALRDFDEAAIFTIHSFCQRVLGDRAFESATLANQKLVPDEREMLRAVAVDYWRVKFYDCNDCLAAAAQIAGLNVQKLVDVLGLRLQQPAARILPAAAPGDLDLLCGEIEETFEKIRACWRREEKEVRHHFSVGANGWAKNKYDDAEAMQARLDAIGQCMSVPQGDVEGHRALGYFAASEIASHTRVRRPPPKLEFFDLCEELRLLGRRFDAAVRLDFLHWAPPRLAQQKAQLGVHSYGDLLTRVEASLHGPGGEGMVAAVRARYRAALVDEFQDTDSVQDAIFTRLFGHGEAWLFLIGDPKQAIYSFRGADVFTYLRAAKRVGAERTYTLGTNYRSAEKLVAGTNAIFGRDERSFVLEELHFHPVASCGEREGERFRGDGHEAPLRIWQWEGDPDTTIPEVRAGLLRATAAEIARLLSGSARLGEKPVTPRDIAVLVSANDHARDMQNTLADFGVPSVLLEAESVFRARDARELHTILSAILRPADEALLRGALLTDALGLRFAELDALGKDGAAWERWIYLFRGWHAAWQGPGFMAMFQRFLNEGGVPARLLARGGGERRLTNLLHLSELLQKATLEERLGPRGLVKWLARQMAQPDFGNEEQQVRLERDDEAVRVVTIHKAKGLEYNIVFCPLLIRGASGVREVRFHAAGENALTVDLGSPDEETHRRLAEREALADDVRKIYVALTRAKQRCDFVWGRYKDADSSALGRLLHPPPDLLASIAEMQAHIAGLTQEQQKAQLDALVEQAAGAIAIHPVPSAEAPWYRASMPPPESLTARRFKGSIARDWCVSSFSSLTESHDAEVPDYDFPRPEVIAAESDAPPEGIHALPGGTRTGNCVHEIFENLEFTDDAAINPLVESKLRAFAFPEKWGKTVSDCVRHTLQAPLPDGFRLADLPAESRLAELEFFLPAGRLEAGRLRDLLRADGMEEMDRMDFSPRQGWLKGFIDLLAVHEGRFYIFDWKTNRLGDRGSAYVAPALAAAMAAHRYSLQLHLYTLAVHRYLARRVRGYDYDKHFGGAYYLFLRGIDPLQPRLGVYHRRPKTKTIAALETWLAGPEPDLFEYAAARPT